MPTNKPFLQRSNTWALSLLLAALMALCGVAPGLAANSLYIAADSPGPGLEEIPAAQLKTGGAATPIVITNVSSGASAIGVCFDKKKNLWAPTLDLTLLEFT